MDYYYPLSKRDHIFYLSDVSHRQRCLSRLRLEVEARSKVFVSKLKFGYHTSTRLGLVSLKHVSGVTSFCLFRLQIMLSRRGVVEKIMLNEI